jgi:competence protein ComEA
MSDPLPELPRPAPPPTWRDRLAVVAESLDLSPTRLAVGLLVIAALGFGGWHLLEAPPPPIEMRLPMATTTPAAGPTTTRPTAPGAVGGGAVRPEEPGTEVVVHVAGAVVGPGVQRLPAGARVVDAIDAAGGAAPDADLGRVNLAAPLEDGQQVYVPKAGEPSTGAPAAVPGPGPGGAAGGSPPVVNLNTATLEELDGLPGVGPAIAQAIVDHRAAHGPFASVEELLEVRGIGQAKLDEIRPRVAL